MITKICTDLLWSSYIVQYYKMRESNCTVNLFLLVVSLHTNPIHCLTHSFAVSFYIIRSAREHICCNSGRLRRCAIVWSASLHSHVVSSCYICFNFYILYLIQPIFLQNLLRYLYYDQVPDAPLARDSLGVCICW